MTPAVTSLVLIVSKYAMMACTFNLVNIAMQPLKVMVDNKIKMMEAQMSEKGEM